MPKHVPTFKHLIASSSTSNDRQPPHERSRSVNDILASYRAQKPGSRDVPPLPSVRVGGVSGIEDVVESGVFPAEELRRAQIAQRSARRRVAGPAPPPSWSSSNASHQSVNQSDIRTSSSTSRQISQRQLYRASSLLSHRPSAPAGRLVEHCLSAVLVYLQDETLLSMDSHDEEEISVRKGDGDGVEEVCGGVNSVGVGDGGKVTLGQIMRDQVGYLAPHLKSALLDLASIQPQGSRRRLGDKSIRAILYSPSDIDWTVNENKNQIEDKDENQEQSQDDKDKDNEEGGEEEEEGEEEEGKEEEGEEDDDESLNSWDTNSSTSSSLEIRLQHLSLTLHPNPIPLLRHLSPLIPSSLNLAYSSIPDLSKLVQLLPASMRELGLCGVKIKGSLDHWRRGLAALGRKMLVLKVSHPPTFQRNPIQSSLYPHYTIPIRCENQSIISHYHIHLYSVY
ncbi:hypothetical protein BCR39DRAFT_512456 [Naematelia encephala]|uniref:Uncharacterized protein n=1 Tax=Naematelia encephala TaxID=71784 RepID=A0A1Y2BM51_9TREE|nr:hypothetical protein BCR39DRAFT_512456 [Naematelia encephala]